MDGGAWWAIVHGVSKSRTQLSDFTFKTESDAYSISFSYVNIHVCVIIGTQGPTVACKIHRAVTCS